MAGLVFVWTPVHFWALALFMRSDYDDAGVPMLTVTHGRPSTRRHILAYTVLLVPVALWLAFSGVGGPVTLVVALALNAWFLKGAVAIWRRDEAMAEAEVGDDVFRGDPTVNRLQEESAAVLGFEAALFVPSGVMANQLSIMAQTRHGDEVIGLDERRLMQVEPNPLLLLDKLDELDPGQVWASPVMEIRYGVPLPERDNAMVRSTVIRMVTPCELPGQTRQRGHGNTSQRGFQLR